MFLVLHRFNPLAFPAQVRIAHVAWLALGTFVPQLWIMMVITTIGLGANLLFGYCPLARMLSLLPWNRAQPMSARLAVETFFSRPVRGRFVVK